MKQLNIFLILILLIGLTNVSSSQELHQLTTRQITQPTIIEQQPIVKTKTEQTRSSHALPSEIKVGGVFPIVKRPEAGRDRRDAFLIAIYEINNQTGADRILPEGVTLVPNVQDDDNSAAGGTAAAQTLISWGADIVIGSSGSSVSAAMAVELTPHKIPQISYASASPVLSNRTEYPYFMRVSSSDADQAKAIADLVLAFNWTNGATIYSDDSYGAGQKNYFTQLFEVKGGTILTDQPFATGASDVSSQIQAIKLATPEFILGSFIDVDATTVMAEARNQNIDTIPWIMTGGWSVPSTFSGNSTVQDAMQKAVGTTPMFEVTPKYEEFNTTWFDPAWNWLEGPAYSQSMGTPFNPYAPFAYDTVYVAAKGLANAGTVDGDSLLTALYNVTHEGASGSIEFNDLGEVYNGYNYVQLIDQTFEEFGRWDGIPTFTTGTLTLHDGSGWLILNDMLSRLTSRGPISINSNADLNTSFPGIGTIDDPIRIEGWNITDSSETLISISGTTLYFHISNNLLNGLSSPNDGIFLADVTHGTIENNIIHGFSGGILLHNTNETILEYNTVYNNDGGIGLGLSSTKNTVTNNMVFNNTFLGLDIHISSHNNTITNNTIFNNNEHGIAMVTSNNNLITSNTIYGNGWGGILVEDSTDNTIESNAVHDNSGNGIKLETSISNTDISHNVIYDNEFYGIAIDVTSNDNAVVTNDFLNNNIGGSQAADNGFDNVFAYNYWSDWTSPDLDVDGIVDAPYSIEGNSNNQDQYPLVVSSVNHYLLVPIITSPSGDETLSGDVSISWSTSVDTWGYSVTYKVSYSMDGGTTWITLITDVTATTFIWDTSTVLDGLNYFLKVEAVSTGGINISSISTSALSIDNTPPVVSIVSPLEQTYTTDMITVTLSGDANHYWYYIVSVDSQNQTWTDSVDRTLTDGIYTLHAYGNDSIGRTTHISVTFTISITTTTTTPTTTPTTTTTTTSTPSWNVLLLLLALFAMLSWRQRKR
ncbi:MAG: ABC transporter substrate-binding protein [Candidatus Hodarchaeales archaeon]